MEGGSILFVHCSACSKNIVSFTCNGFGPFWIYSLRHLELQNVWYFPSLPKPPCPPSLASEPQLSHRLETSSALGLFDIPSSSVLLTQIAYDVFRHGFFDRRFWSHPPFASLESKIWSIYNAFATLGLCPIESFLFTLVIIRNYVPFFNSLNYQKY